MLGIFFKTEGHTACPHTGVPSTGDTEWSKTRLDLWEPPACGSCLPLAKLSCRENESHLGVHPSSCLGALMGLGLQEGGEGLRAGGGQGSFTGRQDLLISRTNSDVLGLEQICKSE